jgi:hypothetical protein
MNGIRTRNFSGKKHVKVNDYSLFLVWLMVLYATFNNISVISWRSVLLVEEIGVPGENHRHAASNWQLYPIHRC